VLNKCQRISHLYSSNKSPQEAGLKRLAGRAENGFSLYWYPVAFVAFCAASFSNFLTSGDVSVFQELFNTATYAGKKSSWFFLGFSGMARLESRRTVMPHGMSRAQAEATAWIVRAILHNMGQTLIKLKT
jgi:hypothetical protein